MIFTPSNVEHAVYFPTETVVISVSKLNRTHQVHEADVIRLAESMIDPEWLAEQVAE